MARLIGNLGDVNPLQYGGFLVWETDYKDTEGNPTYEAEVIETDDQNEEAPLKIYSFPLDRRQWLGDVYLKEDVLTLSHYQNEIPWDSHRSLCTILSCPYRPGQYTEWWDDSIQSIADSSGLTVEQLCEAQVSTDPMQLAAFYHAVVQCYGPHEFDQYPLTLTPKEARVRYARTFAGARRRKVGRIDIYSR